MTSFFNDNIRPIIAGTLANIIAVAVSQPLEVLKVNLQLTFKTDETKPLFVIIIQKIYRKHGFRGFWKGHCITQLTGILQSAVIFWAYERARHYLGKSFLHDHPYKIDYISGFFAGTCAFIIVQPFELINTRRMSAHSSKVYSNIFWSVEEIVKNNGLVGLFRGGYTHWLQMANIFGLRFLIYKTLSSYMAEDQKRKELQGYKLMICGALTGLLCNLITFPMGLIKRQIQVYDSEEHKGVGKTCNNIKLCAKIIYKTEGFRGFYGGVMPSMIKGVVSSAIVFALYDKISLFIKHVF